MYSSKTVLKLAQLLVFIGAAVGSITFFRVTSQSDVFLSTTSPQGTYTVRLTGQKGRPKIPFAVHQVFFSVDLDSKVFLLDQYFHSGDWLDPSFNHLYPEHRWLGEDILQFYKEEFFNDGQPESIVVLNRTNRVIQYLRVTPLDTFLLFNVAPHSSVTLRVSPSRTDSRWISVQGQFQGGQPIKGNGSGFLFPKEKQGPFSYRVYIFDDHFTIESADLEKYKAG